MYLCSKDFCTVLVALFGKTGVHGKMLLQNTAFCNQKRLFAPTSVSWLCAWLRNVFAFGCNSDSSLKNLDKTSYCLQLESKI